MVVVLIEIEFVKNILRPGKAYLSVNILGDTYEFRDIIKQNGFHWDKWSGRWRKQYDNTTLMNLDKATIEVPNVLSKIIGGILKKLL